HAHHRDLHSLPTRRSSDLKGNKKEVKTLNAFIKLTRASESINDRLNRHHAEQNLTVSQFGVLEALLHLGSLNQKALGKKLLKSGDRKSTRLNSSHVSISYA